MPDPASSRQSRQLAGRAQFLRGAVDNRTALTRISINPNRFTKPAVNQAGAVDIIQPQPFVKPAAPKQQPSQVLRRPALPQPLPSAVQPSSAQIPAPVQPLVEPPKVQPILAQQFQPSTEPQFEPSRQVKRRAKLQAALITMACLVFGVGMLVSIETWQTNNNAKAQVSALSAKSDGSDADAPPSETKPSSASFSNYTVAPDSPRYLKISKLGVNARVMSVGVTKTGALGTPNNIYDTAWYNASARPGDAGSNGAVLIDGHVHGPTLPGVFANLKKLQVGDTLQIVRGDGKIFTYTVKKVQNYDASTLNTGMLLTSIQPGEPGLNLVTCGGPFDKVSGEYTQRTVVFAVQS